MGDGDAKEKPDSHFPPCLPELYGWKSESRLQDNASQWGQELGRVTVLSDAGPSHLLEKTSLKHSHIKQGSGRYYTERMYAFVEEILACMAWINSMFLIGHCDLAVSQIYNSCYSETLRALLSSCRSQGMKASLI